LESTAPDALLSGLNFLFQSAHLIAHRRLQFPDPLFCLIHAFIQARRMSDHSLEDLARDHALI
jgi:hypothetical protein